MPQLWRHRKARLEHVPLLWPVEPGHARQHSVPGVQSSGQGNIAGLPSLWSKSGSKTASFFTTEFGSHYFGRGDRCTDPGVANCSQSISTVGYAGQPTDGYANGYSHNHTHGHVISYPNGYLYSAYDHTHTHLYSYGHLYSHPDTDAHQYAGWCANGNQHPYVYANSNPSLRQAGSVGT